MSQGEIAIFALNSSREFGERVCAHLATVLCPHEEREFEDGEHKARPLVNVRGKDVFVIQSLYGDAQQSVNDKLCRLLFFLGALRDASAAQITAVVPYLCYARKDRQTKPRDPVTTRYVAVLFEAMGIGGILTLDVHNLAAFQNAWRIRSSHLEARKLFLDHFIPVIGEAEVVVVSPDAGAIKRSEAFRESLARALGRDVHAAFIEKYRSAGVIRGQSVVGDVDGRIAIIIDDQISSGATMVRAAEACRARGASSVYAAATHGVFSSQANGALSHAALEQVAVTNSVALSRVDMSGIRDKLAVLDATALFAEAIRRIHSGGSIVDLISGEWKQTIQSPAG